MARDTNTTNSELTPTDPASDADDLTSAIDPGAGDIKTTVADPDRDVGAATEVQLTVGDGEAVYTDDPDVGVENGADLAVTDPDAGADDPATVDETAAETEIATEAARRDDTESGPPGSILTVEADELPIADYDALSVDAVLVAVRTLVDEADLTVVEEYERGHKNRDSVVTAAQERTEALARDT
ncbi:MAG: hypothetical protein JOY78_03735, partial [Pseudonocardia sp.]|nr:hypothetical protein [Pseudonocardia sp.]